MGENSGEHEALLGLLKISLLDISQDSFLLLLQQAEIVEASFVKSWGMDLAYNN